MTTWNYRLILEGDTLSMHEVHYDEDGAITQWAQNFATPVAETVDGIGEVLQLMAEALGRPVLTFNDDGLLVEPT